MVPEMIARLDRWLAANRPDYYSRLQPGVSNDQLKMFEERFSLQLPIAFRLLYKWRNGQDAACSKSFEMNWMFASLESIAETKEILDGMIGEDFESPDWWRREWVPFLGNGGGDHLVVDLIGTEGGKPRQILTFWHDDPDRPIEHANMEAWLEDLLTSMEGGTLELV